VQAVTAASLTHALAGSCSSPAASQKPNQKLLLTSWRPGMPAAGEWDHVDHIADVARNAHRNVRGCVLMGLFVCSSRNGLRVSLQEQRVKH